MVCVQLIARKHSGQLLDDDNLQGAFKGLRDAIASWLGVDDGNPAIKWEYDQVTSSAPEGTLVTIDLL